MARVVVLGEDRRHTAALHLTGCSRVPTRSWWLRRTPSGTGSRRTSGSGSQDEARPGDLRSCTDLQAQGHRVPPGTGDGDPPGRGRNASATVRRHHLHRPGTSRETRNARVRLLDQRDRAEAELRCHARAGPRRVLQVRVHIGTRQRVGGPAGIDRADEAWPSPGHHRRMGHGTAPAKGAFEYAFNVEHEVRQAGVRDLADIIYLTNEYELGTSASAV